jgi:hypothetical protein
MRFKNAAVVKWNLHLTMFTSGAPFHMYSDKGVSLSITWYIMIFARRVRICTLASTMGIVKWRYVPPWVQSGGPTVQGNERNTRSDLQTPTLLLTNACML